MRRAVIKDNVEEAPIVYSLSQHSPTGPVELKARVGALEQTLLFLYSDHVVAATEISAALGLPLKGSGILRIEE